jgi:hypothetical protein
MSDRVIPYAKSTGANWYQPEDAPPWQWMSNNRNWINAQMDQGANIVDIGPDPLAEGPSEYHQMEQGEIAKRDYSNYLLFDPGF